MSITLIYTLKLLLLPPAGLLIPAITALLFGERKKARIVAIVCLALLLLLSLPVVVNQVARFWERIPPISSEAVQQLKPEGLVVIGGGLAYRVPEYPGRVTLNTRTLLRIRYAAKLSNELGLRILVSGGSVEEPEVLSEADLMAEALDREFKTPVAWLERESMNTAENARFSRKLLNEFGINKIVLVTQAYHMPRAALEFRKAGFEVLPAPTAFIGHAGKLRLFDWFPSTTAWANSYLLVHEMIGMLWYRICC